MNQQDYGIAGNTAFQLIPVLNSGDSAATDKNKNVPKPLLRQLPKAEQFPLDALGHIMAPAARLCNQVIKAPEAICGASFLATAHLVTQAHVDLVIDGRTSPVSNFFVTIATSGARKSGVDDVAMNPINILQKSRRIDHELAQDKFVKDKEHYDLAFREATGGKKTKEEREAALQNLEEPIEPKQPDLILPDVTYEGLYDYLKEHQASVGVFTDEGGSFLGGHAMKDENRIKTAAGLSKLWGKGEDGRCRRGGGTSSIFGKRVSLHVMIQPNLGRTFMNDASLKDQGLLSRCLVASVEVKYGRKYVAVDLSQTAEVRKYTDHVLLLLARDMNLTGKRKNILNPRKVGLSPEAKELYIRFHDSNEELMQKGRIYSEITGLASKAAEHAARIALALAAFEDLDVACVSGDWMAKGIEIVQFYLSEAVRLTDAGSVDSETEQADQLREWLKARGKSVVTLVDTYQRGPKRIRTAKAARFAMMALQLHGWVVPIEAGAADDSGTHRPEAWEVSTCL